MIKSKQDFPGSDTVANPKEDRPAVLKRNCLIVLANNEKFETAAGQGKRRLTRSEKDCSLVRLKI